MNKSNGIHEYLSGCTVLGININKFPSMIQLIVANNFQLSLH